MKTTLQLILVITFLIFGKGFGQADGTLDASFNSNPGFTNRIYHMELQSDGKILAKGSNSLPGGTLVRLNPDGSQDVPFNPTVSSNSEIFALQPDGKIIADHNTLDWSRFNADGTVDATYSGGYFNNVVQAIKVQPDGKILFGGRFNKYENITVPNFISRINSNGTIDTSFLTTGTGFSGTATPVAIDAIAVQPDGKILVGGNFETYNGQPQTRIARLNADGSLDSSFNLTNQLIAGSGVFDIALQPDGKILVGGSFQYESNGVTKWNFIRLNSDGTLDTSFSAGTFTNGLIPIASIKVLANGKILVGGSYTIYDAQNKKGIVRLNSDGSLDTSFETGTGFSDNLFNYFLINALAVQPDGKIIAAGGFKSYNGQVAMYIARLNSSGPPAPPSNLTAVPYNSILLNWQDNSSNEDGFNVYSATNSNGPWSLITTTSANTTSYIHSGLTNGVEYFYRVTAFNSNGASSFSNTSSAVENTLAVSEIDREKMMIYPNPANGFVKISNIHQNSKITVYDLSGKIVHSEKSKASETTINSENFASGVYYVLIESNEGKITKKIIVKH